MWLPFIFSDTHGRAAQRHSRAAVRRRRHRAQQSDVPAQRRARRATTGRSTTTWTSARGSTGGAPPVATNGDPGWIKLQRRLGLQVDRSLPRRSYRRRLHDAARSDSTEPRDQLVPQAGFLARQPPEHAASTTSRTRRCSGRTRSIRYTALATIASQATYQNQAWPRVVLARAQRASSIRAACRSIRRSRRSSLTSTPIALGNWLSWTPTLQLQPQRRAAHRPAGSRSLRVPVDSADRRADSIAVERPQLGAIVDLVRHAAADLRTDFKNSFRINQQRNDFPQQVPDLRSEYGCRDGDRASSPRPTAPTSTGRRTFTLPPFAQKQVQPDAERQPAERGSGTVLGGERAHEWAIRAPVQALDLRASRRRRRCSGCFAASVRSSAFRHSISPSIGYSYAPEVEVSDEYLLALGRTRVGLPRQSAGRMPFTSG